MALQNAWVGYIDRTYEQIKDNVLTKFKNLVPEITDHTESNTWVKGISIWSGLIEMIGYYQDNRAREVFLPTCRRFESAVKIARLFNYRIKGAVAASTDLTFTTNIPTPSLITIPLGTVCRTPQGVEFRTTEVGLIQPGQSTVQVTAKQWIPVPNVPLGTSDGSIDQKFTLDENVVDNAINVQVGTTNWAPLDTLAYSIGDSEAFVAGVNEENKMEVQFGDGVNGAIPASASSVVASYYTTDGSLGNITTNRINIIVDSITLDPSVELSVTNLIAASGGSNSETLEKLRKTIPYSLRTKDRAVTDQDFIDLAQLVPGVAKAGVSYSCGASVLVYIAPEGGGVPSQTLINEVLAYYETRRIITTKVTIVGAGEVVIEITANIKALPNFTNLDVKSRIEQNLIEFLSIENQEIGGQVVIGDIYEVIEKTAGVDVSVVSFFNTIPFGRPIDGTTTILNWERQLSENSQATVQWVIRFISTTEYELTKDGSFIGNFTVGVQVSQTEISFKIISNGYAINDQYAFTSYPYNDSRIVLEEPSVPVTNLSGLNLTVTGGIE